MDRVVASLPGSIAELALARIGLIARRWSARGAVRSLAKAAERAATEAKVAGAGLLHAERFAAGTGHVVLLQYWRDYESMEAWTRRPPHSEWWRSAVDRMRRKGDLGVYHESFLVPRANVESIYLDSPPVGLMAFGDLDDANGPRTAARDRLGRRGGG